MQAHVASCPEWLALYNNRPEQALEPVEEYARWQRDSREADRAASREALVAETDSRREVLANRYRTRDILEEE